MEKRCSSDTESGSEQLLGDWDFLFPSVNPEEPISMVSVPTSPESVDATRVVSGDKERGSTSSTVAATEGKRVLPPWMDSSYQWGGGKWKEDGRKKKKKKKKQEEEKEDIIPFKEIIEALLRNSGDKVEEEDEDKAKGKGQSCVEMLKSMGFNFP